MNNKIRLLVKTSLFIAIIALTTTYILHIPTGINGGYIHLGDVFIYIASVILPTKYALISASIGGGLADFLGGAPMFIIPTMIIKPLMVFSFTNKSNKIICKRNIIATLIAILITYIGYSFANSIILGSLILGFSASIFDIIQSAVSGIIFFVLGYLLDRINIKRILK
ncbi:TIGR04002 family protein [Clostridium baratii]|uniref:TIGR04002 family protein n=1 Tax=Clostridium baratii TaxID=1561 RepID=UPI0009A30A51|nr:TIGR04002 family protein [Clostridium baratii]